LSNRNEMISAKPHPCLVPFDGTFKVSKVPTLPEENQLESNSWRAKLEEEKRHLGRWQHKLYADGRYAVLLVFQAMDAGGKDSTIRHVLTGINPTGVRVTSFKHPSTTELAHDFLWRTVAHLPEHGHIGVFNRSYYEEVLVVRVRPELLLAQQLPFADSDDIWRQRYRSIVDHETHLAESGTIILKFWLNVSKEEQRQRFLRRIEQPNKRWKFRAADLNEREHWDEYMAAYEQCLQATSRPWAPWYAVPADDKAFMYWQVARLINDAFEQIAVDFPAVDAETVEELDMARQRLLIR